MEMVDNKLMLEKLKLSIKAFNKRSNEDIKRLRETAFIESFGKLNNLHNCVELWLLEDPIQKAETSTYRPFQIYFYDNVFLLDKKSKIHSPKKSNRDIT